MDEDETLSIEFEKDDTSPEEKAAELREALDRSTKSTKSTKV